MPRVKISASVLPVLPLRGYTLQPGVVAPLFVGRPASIVAVRNALSGGKRLFAVAQKGSDQDPLQLRDLDDVGVIASVQELLKLPDGTIKVELTGLSSARLVSLIDTNGYLSGTVEPVPDIKKNSAEPLSKSPSVGEAPDDIVESITIEGFDPIGDPELRRERSGKLWLVFNSMPPSWAPETEYADFGRCSNFDVELQNALGSPVLWDDREFFLIEQPSVDCIERVKRFLLSYRAKNAPAA